MKQKNLYLLCFKCAKLFDKLVILRYNIYVVQSGVNNKKDNENLKTPRAQKGYKNGKTYSGLEIKGNRR